MHEPTLPAISPPDQEDGMDEKKRALGTGAKCCGECELCADQPVTEPVPQPDDDDFDWGTPPAVDPDDEEDQQ